MNSKPGLLPMPPNEGPPLPRALGLRWPGKVVELEKDELIRTIIRADADYFYSMNFISQPTYQAVLAWLEGNEDTQTRLMVANWLDSDNIWFVQVEAAAMAHFWYFWPATAIGFCLLKRTLKEYSEYLKG